MSQQSSTRQRRRTPSRRRAFLHAGTVQVNGDAIYYQTRGDTELARQTVLLLHGMAADTTVWEDLVQGLSNSYYVIAPDLPGHGQSQGQGLSSVSQYGSFLTGFLAALGIRHPVVVVGHCLGAAIALEFARVAKGRLAGTVISGLSTGPLAHQHLLAALERGEVMEEFIARRLSVSATAEMAQAERLRWYRTRPEVRWADVQATLTFVAAPPPLEATAPLLLVGGEQDELVPVERMYAWQVWYPEAQVRLLPAAGHLSMLERPDLYRAALEGFLSKLAVQPPIPRAWA